MNDKLNKYYSELLEVVLVMLMLMLMFCIIVGINNMQQTARVINYTGLVRGSTQRLVKLELMGRPDPEMEARLDAWIEELHTGEGDSDLAVIKNTAYQERLKALSDYWMILKEDIEDVRQGGERQKLLEDSEVYFVLADELVTSAENYSMIQANHIKTQEFILLGITAVLVIKLVSQAVSSMRLERKIAELNALAYADTATRLPNRASCDQLVAEHSDSAVCAGHGAVMFDLNNLKSVNDRYGHKAGDVLISNFARILGVAAENRCFVGRWGGDEFIAVFENGSQESIQGFLAAVRAKVEEFNRMSDLIHIEYACGCCYCGDDGRNLDELIAAADAKMYEMKAAMKRGKTMQL